MPDIAILICAVILAFFIVAVVTIILKTRARRREIAELTARIEREEAEYEERRRAFAAPTFADEMAIRSINALHTQGRVVPTNSAGVDFWEDLRTFAESLPPRNDSATKTAAIANPSATKTAATVTPKMMPQKRGGLISTAVPKTPRKNAAPNPRPATSSSDTSSSDAAAFIAISTPSFSDAGWSSCDSGGSSGGGCD